MLENFLEIDGIVIEILRKPIKNMHLRVYPPDGQVRVTAPLRLNIQKIQNQIETKIDWLHFQRQKMQSLPSAMPLIQTGGVLPFLGKKYSILVSQSIQTPRIVFAENVFHFFIKPNTTELEKNRLLEQWYRDQMKNLLPSLIEKWQIIIGVTVSEWGIKRMKTRWGSCNTHASRIWLNLSLITKPIECLEYVLVHELVHLLEPSHNSRFYRLMENFLPSWKIHKQSLLAM